MDQYSIFISNRNSVAWNCTQLFSNCAALCRNARNYAEFRGIVRIARSLQGSQLKSTCVGNPNKNTLIYWESIYNIQSYGKLAFCIEKKVVQWNCILCCLSFVKYELTESIYLILESIWHLSQNLNAKSTLISKVTSEQNVSRKNSKIFGRISYFFAKINEANTKKNFAKMRKFLFLYYNKCLMKRIWFH